MLLTFGGGGGGGVVQNRESPDFRSPEVGRYGFIACFLFFHASVCGLAVNTYNSVSGSPGFKPCPSYCFLRQGTLLHFVSLHSGV